MVTMVGTQKNFIEAIKELVELEYDAVSAYETAFKNLENPEYKKKFDEFKSEHQRHIKELSNFLSINKEECPSGPDTLKKLLVNGKVELASLFGDQNILNAVLSNEEDTNTAYERINQRVGEYSGEKEVKISEIIARGLSDEKKHKSWLQNNISKKENEG
jgi:ferritin-like metal-binding protein YciE